MVESMNQQGSIFAEVMQTLGNSDRITHKSRSASWKVSRPKLHAKKDDKVANKTRHIKERHAKGKKRARNED